MSVASTSKVHSMSTDLLPDIRPFEPRDVQIIDKNDRTLLVFSTIYFNQGDGPLELVAGQDPSGAVPTEDIERDVLQNIYQQGGGVREEAVGSFVWHREHLHYHFTDFVDFRLEPTLETYTEYGISAEDISAEEKATFCVRDVSRVYADTQNTPDDAVYRICNEVKQGVSVGWGDTYFFDYPDQDIDVTGLPAGVYRLVFEANPRKRFYESNYENNISWALIDMDSEARTVEVLELYPIDSPEVEHVYPQQDFEKGSSDIDYTNQFVPAKEHRNAQYQ
ncbi:MAG: lysyl oxidase family protein [Candidatus Paceibacterota bacterium]